MESLEIWQCAWYSAITDSERLEALNLLMPLLPAFVTEDQQDEVFKIIDIQYLMKMFFSDRPEEINKDLKTLLLKVLSSFSSNPCTCSFVEPVIEILNDSITLPKNQELILEALNFLLHVVSEESGKSLMLAKDGFIVLSYVYCDSDIGRQQKMDILLSLMSSSELEATSQNEDAFNMLLAKISEQFDNDTTLIKFELCAQILTIFLRCPSFSIQSSTALNLRDTLTIILRNKIVDLHRHNAIKLSSFLIDKVGHSSFLLDTENARTFFLVIVQLACVEIQMLLEDKSISEVIGESFLLTACYTIFEYAIQALITDGLFESKLCDPLPLLNSIKEAISVVIDFLKRAESELPNITFSAHEFNPTEQIVLSTIRVICSWLAEETSALQEKVCGILPIILNVCKEWFQHTDKKESGEKIGPMYFLMAPLCHLAADKKCREILLNNGLLILLFEQFERTWTEYTNTQDDSLVEMMTTLCGILLSIIVLQPDLAAYNTDFFPFLKLLLNGLPIIFTNSEHLVLNANFAALGLLLTKHCYKKVKSCETIFYPFLSASIKFLWDSHEVETQDVRLCLTRKYQAVWNDVMDLWFLGVQALCSLFPIMPWISSYIAASRWPDAILGTLKKVGTSGIDGNIKATYQALLSALVRSNDAVAQALVKSGGIAVCQKHHLNELERLLRHCANPRSLEFK